jgi:hypothetical protein
VVLAAGTIDVDLQVLDARERFRVRSPDGELETRDAHFTLEVRANRVAAVIVSRGQVEMRLTGSAPFIVASGQSWAPPITAQRDEIVPKPDNTTETKPAVPMETNPTEPVPRRPTVAKATTSLRSLQEHPTDLPRKSQRFPNLRRHPLHRRPARPSSAPA